MDGSAYVGSFKFDYFLSYAHVDNQPVRLPGRPAEDGWVSCFYETLNFELNVRLGGRLHSPWKDGRIPLHVSLDEELLETVHEAAILLVMLSPGYLNSDWCRREREAYFSKRPDGPVIIVQKEPVDGPLPPELSKNLIYRFYDEESGSCFGHPLPDDLSDPFFKKVRDLSTYVVKALSDLKQHLEARQAADISGRSDSLAPPVTNGKKYHGTVFLAPVGGELEDQYDATRAFLKQAGVPVLPQEDYSLDPDEFRTAAEMDLSQATVFVQLLSGKRGARPKGCEQGFPTLQFELAKPRVEQGLAVLQWYEPSLNIAEVTDPYTRALLEEPTVRAEPLLTFQQAILKALEPRQAPPRPVGNLVVFVNSDKDDLSLAKQIGGILKQHGARVWLPTQNADPKLAMTDVKTKLGTSHGMIVLYGNTSDVWVNGQIGLYWGWIGETASNLPASIFDVPPPDEKLPLSFIDDNVELHDCISSDPVVLEAEVCRFLERVRGKAA